MSKKYNAESELTMIEMSKEAKAARAQYMREWRRKHPGKESEYTARKWERKAQQIAEAAVKPAEQDQAA